MIDRECLETTLPARPYLADGKTADVGPHLLLLGLCVLVVLLSFVLRIDSTGKVALGAKALPSTCPAAQLTGWPCPGCGLTRSFISLASGEYLNAWKFNPASFVLFPLVMLQIPFRTWQVQRMLLKRFPTTNLLAGPPGTRTVIFLVLLLVIQWLLRLSGFLPALSV